MTLNTEVFTKLIHDYLEWRISLHRSSATIDCDRHNLKCFHRWCNTRYITHPGQVTPVMIVRYRRSLQKCTKKNGQLVQENTQFKRFQAIKMWYAWLLKNRILIHDPTHTITFRRSQRSVPSAILTPDEVEHIMRKPDLTTVLGIRDRTILETLYSTGTRRSELINLSMDDLNRSTMTLFIREGKGKKDRVVPVCKRCVRWVERYLTEARPELVCNPESPAFFLTVEGGPLSPWYLSELVRRYIEQAGIIKPGACHLFRHSMATGMLENGADIRFIQEILGHERLTTTQIYTKVSIKSLKQVHNQTHPAER